MRERARERETERERQVIVLQALNTSEEEKITRMEKLCMCNLGL